VNRAFVIGVGMTKFDKPGTKEGDYPDWAREAGEKALADAGIAYDLVEEAYVGYCYGESTAGQRAVYGLGLTGIPSLGKMVSDAVDYYADYPLYLWMPVGTIALLTLSLNLLGDSIRDAFDPRTRR